MKDCILVAGRICLLSLLLLFFPGKILYSQHASKDTVIVRTEMENNSISPAWKKALSTRMDRTVIDSFARIERSLTKEEEAWRQLILSKSIVWNRYKDSLGRLFPQVIMSDTAYVLLGYLGVDDGFTYGYQSVCLDMTALHRAYGNAGSIENGTRIDRIFSHEYTHLLQKIWAKDNNLQLINFKDSIFWECLYEGIGMYRSLNQKWLPVDGHLPEITEAALKELYPLFAERIARILTGEQLSASDKTELHHGLSRGPVNKKWGAFPVAIWLALEANGNEDLLIRWINKGPLAVIHLALKYLPAEYQPILEMAFQ